MLAHDSICGALRLKSSGIVNGALVNEVNKATNKLYCLAENLERDFHGCHSLNEYKTESIVKVT